MVNAEIILAKTASLKKHLRRIEEKASFDLAQFKADPDSQDIVLFNIQMAVQNCIDIASHIIGDQGFGVPGSNNEMFYMLEENGYLSQGLTEKMVKAVGFRNLIVHEYAKLDIDLVYRIIHKDIQDLNLYTKEILKKCNLG